MNPIEKARNLRKLFKEYAEKAEDKTLVIATHTYFEEWAPGVYTAGDIRTNPTTCYPYECILDHDSKVNTDWTIDVRTLWKPYHSRKKEFALPYEQPTGAHDMYKQGEYMIWTDGNTYKCINDTAYSPDDYKQAWEVV